MNYEQALNFIESKKSLGIKPGLSRVKNLLNAMGNPQNKLHVIHIAGTNGKGSIAAVIANAIASDGYNVGLFTSPWVTDYREQIQINGKMIERSEFADYITEYCDNDATEFELICAVCIKYFADNNTDFAVIECGMGGQNDATNVFENTDIAVITSVSLDHTAFLGKTVEEIAAEKAGIIKQNCKTVLYPNCKAVTDIIDKRCSTLSSHLYKVSSTNSFLADDINTAQAVLNLLHIISPAQMVRLPARQELLTDSLMLDGAHNPDGANALFKTLYQCDNITAVIAMMKDKNIDAYLSVIAPKCSAVIATEVPGNQRSMNSDDLADVAKKYCKNTLCVSDPHKAVQMLKTKGGFKLVCGSFYLAREIRKDLL